MERAGPKAGEYVFLSFKVDRVPGLMTAVKSYHNGIFRLGTKERGYKPLSAIAEAKSKYYAHKIIPGLSGEASGLTSFAGVTSACDKIMSEITFDTVL